MNGSSSCKPNCAFSLIKSSAFPTQAGASVKGTVFSVPPTYFTVDQSLRTRNISSDVCTWYGSPATSGRETLSDDKSLRTTDSQFCEK